MKKIISILIAFLILTTMFCTNLVGVSAADDEIKLKISAITRDGEVEEIKSHKSIEDGWNDAMKLAGDTDEMKDKNYKTVVVDLLADWTADDGEFTDDFFNGAGFDWDTIYVPDKANVILNLNGHTIDRGLKDYEYNGEVISVDEKATFVINGGKDANDTSVMGKITGGFSCNGAGGIHIQDDANVTLNNVSVSGNFTEDDDGAGIALYNGATLTVNGGEISNNTIITSLGAQISSFQGTEANMRYGAGVYVKNATATFNNVSFTKNEGKYSGNYKHLYGNVISAMSSTVTMNDCKVFDNATGYTDKDDTTYIFRFAKSTLVANGCEFYENGSQASYLMYLDRSEAEMKNCKFHDNDGEGVLLVDTCEITFEGIEIYDNGGKAIRFYNVDSSGTVSNSKFNNNCTNFSSTDISFDIKCNDLTFEDCDFGDSTFGNKGYANYIETSTRAASIFSDGSLATIISITSLVIAIGTLATMIIIYKKSKKEAK